VLNTNSDSDSSCPRPKPDISVTFSLEKRRLQGHLIVAFQYIKGAYRRDGERLFTKVCSDRTRHGAFKLKEDRFRLDMRKKFFMVRLLRH